MARKSSGSTGSDPGQHQVMMDIHRIQPYERNPRHGANPEYARIKDSIRQNGIDQPLVITQRPDSPDYIVHSGGNTRLVILRELFEETGEAGFSQVPCLIKPWSGEANVVLAHLRENDLRGDLTFIDKARAIEDARRLLIEELGLKSLTQRRFAAELGKAGYRIGHPSLSLMAYTVNTLSGLIPVALESGLGRDKVTRIRALERAGLAVWLSHCTGGEPAFESVFATLCRRYDAPEWDNTVLQSALETEIAEASDSNLQTIRAAFDAALNKQEVVIPAFVPIKAPPEPGKERRTDEESSPDDPLFGQPDSGSASPGGDVGESPEITDTLVEPSVAPESSDSGAERLPIDTGDATTGDLKSLRGRAWTLAARIAQRNGIGELVLPLPGKGLGYVLRDVPAPDLADQLDDTALAQVSILWWQLAACAEMTAAPLDSVLPNLPPDSVLRRALEDDDPELLFKSIWTLDPGHTGYRLWRLMHDRDWADLLSLMDNYRRIRHVATQTGATLWN